MTTERLYYNDSYTLQFQADVIEQTAIKDRPALVLDRTYFYPEGGGQPPDNGQLNGVRVVDVQTREADRAVLHIMDAPLADAHVEGAIDAARRLDHMQHHSGQHVLSQALEQAGRARTLSVHMSADSMTIDVDRADISPDEWAAVEELANQIVLENRAVRTWFPTDDELAALNIRKMPDVVGKVRIVDVGSFDITACGGTHVARTGEIGLIKVVKADRRGATTRLEFRCGGRSLRDYRSKNGVINRLTSALTVGYTELPDTVDRLQSQNKALQSALDAAKRQLAEAEAGALIAAAPEKSGYKLIARAYADRPAEDLRMLAAALTVNPGVVALLGAAGEKAQLIFSRSEGVAPDMAAVLKVAFATLGAGKGGGRPNMAQGGGVPATVEALEAAIAAAVAAL